MDLNRLKSTRLDYRLFCEADYDDLFAFLSLEEVCVYLPGDSPYNGAQVKKWLNYFIQSFDETKPNLIYAVTLKNDPEVIGYVGLAYVNEFSENEIMYAFHPKVWGKGFATEGSKKMKEIAVHLKLKKLIGLTDIDNIASEKILIKIGYQKIKTLEMWGLKMKYFELDLNNIDKT